MKARRAIETLDDVPNYMQLFYEFMKDDLTFRCACMGPAVGDCPCSRSARHFDLTMKKVASEFCAWLKFRNVPVIRARYDDTDVMGHRMKGDLIKGDLIDD